MWDRVGKARVLSLLLPITSILLLSCHRLPLSIGKLREIVIATSHKEEIEPIIIDILQNDILTPQPEPEFLIRWIEPERLKDFATFHTIFIIGKPEDRMIRDMGELVMKKRFGLFRLKDLWARNQLICVFIAKDSLALGLRRYALRIHYTFEQNLLKRLEEATYREGYDERLTRYLLDRYGFGIKVPKGFMIDERFKENNFIYIFGHNPDRSIFIYWGKRRDLDKNRLLALRDSLTQRFYGGDILVKNLTTTEETDFLGSPGLRILGVWENEKEVIGGPFISYCFNYNDRFFFIDGTLFLPGKRKLTSLFQLKIILKTFKVER